MRVRTAVHDSVDILELASFLPKQRQALAAALEHRYTLFGGARGPGKSYWLRWSLLYLVLRWAGRGIPGVRVMLACESYPALKDRQISRMSEEFPHWLGRLYECGRRGLGFHLREEYGGGSILLRNLDDPDKYLGLEVAAIGVDEVALISERTFRRMLGSMRWPGIEDTRFLATSNPAPNWVRRYWIERDLPDELADAADEFYFVPALPKDNPHLPPSYWDELRRQPPHVQRAWLHGDWYAGVEGVVYADFSDGNVVDREPEPEHPFEIAFDDGYVDPRAVLFVQRLPDGGVLVFDEIYHVRRLEEETVSEVLERCVSLAGKRLPADWGARSLSEKARWCRENDVPLPELAVGSPEANQLMARFRQADIPARGASHRVVEGINKVRALIWDGRRRSLFVHRRCRNLLDEIRSGYRYDPDRPSEKPVDGNDHGCDALRYWVWLRV